MKYYLDVNAIIKLYHEKIDNDIIKNTYVSRLAISEMLKNIRKNYSRQEKQFKYINNSSLNIDWTHYESLLFQNPFGYKKKEPKDHVKDLYKIIIRSDKYEDFNNGLKGLIPFHKNYSIIKDIIEDPLIEIFFQNIEVNYLLLYNELLEKDDFYKNKPEYKIHKDILKKLLLYNFGNNLKLKPKELSLFRKKLKEYDGSIDLYLDSITEYFHNSLKDPEKNDAPDLLHLCYLKNDCIFVTDDKSIQELVSKVAQDRVINVGEYTSRMLAKALC